MTRSLIAILVALAFPTSAVAGNGPTIPGGNSGANQYIEDIPTAGGPVPSQPTQHHPAAGRTGTSSPSSAAISPSTSAQLARDGSTGRAAAAAAAATAPRTAYRRRSRSAPGRTRRPHGRAAGGSVSAGAPSGPSRPSGPSGGGQAGAASVAGAVTGISGAGGLLVALAVAAAAAVALAVRRHAH